MQRPCHVDVGLCSEPAGPAHLLRQGAPVHLRWLQVARVQNLWGEVSWHHLQFNKKTLEVVHMQMVSMEKNSPKISWIKDHYHDHRLKPQLEDDPLGAEPAQ